MFVDAARDDPVARGDSVDERIRPAVQEGYVERRNSSRVMEPGCAERAIRAHGKYDKAVRVSLIREHKLWCAVRIRRGLFVEVDVDEEEFLVRREHGHGGNTIGLVLRIH